MKQLTDAEKYAMIFRASSDGIRENVNLYFRDMQVQALASAFAGVAAMFEKIAESETESASVSGAAQCCAPVAPVGTDRELLKAIVKLGRQAERPQSNAWIAERILAAGFARAVAAERDAVRWRTFRARVLVSVDENGEVCLLLGGSAPELETWLTPAEVLTLAEDVPLAVDMPGIADRFVDARAVRGV